MENNLPDNELLAQNQLLESLIDEYGTELKRLAFLYVKDKSLAEDILQEVFISCYQNLDSFRKDSSYKTWLIRITVNKSKDALKKWSLRNIFYRASVKETADFSTPEDHLMKKTGDDYLAMQVMSLPLKLREVIILFYYEDLSLVEISSILNINLNTVKSRLFRAKSTLKEAMEGSENEWMRM